MVGSLALSSSLIGGDSSVTVTTTSGGPKGAGIVGVVGGNTVGGVTVINPSGSFYTGPDLASFRPNRIGADERLFATGVRRGTLSGINLINGYRDQGFAHPIFSNVGSGYPGIDGADIATINLGVNGVNGANVLGTSGGDITTQVGSPLIEEDPVQKSPSVGSRRRRRS